MSIKSINSAGHCLIFCLLLGDKILNKDIVHIKLICAVYTLGSAEPRSFSRGKRGIAGNLVFIVFNRDALLSSLEDRKITKYKDNDVVTMLNE